MKKLIYNFILIAMLLWGAVLPAQVVLLALDAPYFTATKTETAGKTFYRNNCGSGYTGGSRYVSRTATATATSTISQADAESKASTQAYNNALALVNSQGQSEANTYGTCTYNGGGGGGGGTIYTATRQASYSGTFTKNNCPAGQTGTQVTYTTPTYTETRTSTVSQADANNLAQNAANAKAQADLNANGQTYANNNGTCISAIKYWKCTKTTNIYQSIQGWITIVYTKTEPLCSDTTPFTSSYSYTSNRDETSSSRSSGNTYYCYEPDTSVDEDPFYYEYIQYSAKDYTDIDISCSPVY